MRDRKKRNFLVVTLAERAIDLKRFGALIGAARLSFASADRLMEVLGVEPGAVTPFALINDPQRAVTVVLDAALLDHGRVNFHPLVNTATTAIAPGDLVAFIRACGHTPRLVTFR